MTLWFTADHYFGHDNIIHFRDRPFADTSEMDETMVERWNSTIQEDGEVWHLGNFAHRCGPNRRAEIFSRLRGRAIHLIRGPHDRKSTLTLPWASVQHYAEIRSKNQQIILFHYPLTIWNRSHQGSLSLHGRALGVTPKSDLACDVSVDAWDFRPISLDEIMARIALSGTGAASVRSTDTP